MNDGVFVKVGGGGKGDVSNKKSHPKYKAVYFADDTDADNMGEYSFGRSQSGQQGTLVPIGQSNGSIHGKDSNSVYGQVVTGYNMGYQDGVGEIPRGEFIPDFILKDRKSSGRGSGSRSVYTPESDTQGRPNLFDIENEHLTEEEQEHVRRCLEERNKALELANEQGLQELLGDQPPSQPATRESTFRSGDGSDWGSPNASNQAPVMQNTPAPIPIQAQHIQHKKVMSSGPVFVPKKISMKGDFGKFRTNCNHVIVTAEYVALIIGPEESVFTPPVNSENSITLSCDDFDYKVYFIGTEFELDFINCSIQVFHRE